MAVLAAASSVVAEEVTVPVGAGATAVAAVMLGVPVLRVSVAVAAGLETGDGDAVPFVRVGRAAATSAWLVVGSEEGMVRAWLLLTVAAARSTWLLCGASSLAAAALGLVAAGAGTAAVAATSGRVVRRGCRFGAGAGD